jgi:hypothetical protein
MATSEIVILKAFIDKRQDFEKYGPYILALKNMTRVVSQTLGYVKKFYEKYPSSITITEPEFRLFLGQDDVNNFVKNNEVFLRNVFTTNLSNNDLKMDIIEASVERHLMASVIDKAALVIDNGKSGVLSSLQGIIDEYHSIIRKPPQDYTEYKLDLDELLQEEVISSGCPFVNQTPNDTIRGMRSGQLGLIYAYVDTGKTSYGVANLCAVAKYLQDNNVERPVIYAVNEERVQRVTLRAIQCMTNWDNDEINKNKNLVRSIIKARGFKNMLFMDHVTTMPIVEKLLIKHSPKVIFIDQGTKVQIPGSSREGVNALEEIFNRYRDMAKRYDCTIVTMAQGGDDCFQKKYPSLRDIYGSKSAIQGELDWAISIGVDISDVKYENFRYFNISKNKGDKATYACRFDHKRCQFKEVT